MRGRAAAWARAAWSHRPPTLSALRTVKQSAAVLGCATAGALAASQSVSATGIGPEGLKETRPFVVDGVFHDSIRPPKKGGVRSSADMKIIAGRSNPELVDEIGA